MHLLFARRSKVSKTPWNECPARFSFLHKKSRYAWGFLKGEKWPMRPPERALPISRKMEKQAKIPSGKGVDVYLSSSIPRSLYFPFFPGIHARRRRGLGVHQRRSNTENWLDVSPATRRNSLRRAEERNSLRNPSCVYVFTEAAEILRGNK